MTWFVEFDTSSEFTNSIQAGPRAGPNLLELSRVPESPTEAERRSLLVGAKGGKQRLSILPGL